MLSWVVRETAESNTPTTLTRIDGPEDSARLLIPILRPQSRELFVIIPLDTKGRSTGVRLVSMGSLSASIVHPREVFREAIAANAASIVMAHNHPSSDPTPSPEDLAVTRKMVEAGKIMGIPVLDHMIIGNPEWVSLGRTYPLMFDR